MPTITPKPEDLAPLIFMIRGEKVLLDADLAELYGVSTSALNQAVRRNRNRFPKDFMFRLTAAEWRRMKSQNTLTNNELTGERSQIVIASLRAGALRSQTVTAFARNVRALPYAFTEQGVAMLSSVLRSARAVEVNSAIM